MAEILRDKFVCYTRAYKLPGADQAFPKELKPGQKHESMGRGFYLLNADGEIVESIGASTYFPEELLPRLTKFLASYKPIPSTLAVEACPQHKTHEFPVAKDAPYVNVTAKVLIDPEKWEYKHKGDRNYVKLEKVFFNSVGRDHLALEKEEVAALVRDELPEALKSRIANVYLLDSTRGFSCVSAGGWGKGTTKKVEMKLEKGLLTGTFLLDHGKTGFQGTILGHIEAKAGTLTRFDLVAKGQWWGSTDAGDRLYPEYEDGKKVPLGVAFQLITDERETALMPPFNVYHQNCPHHSYWGRYWSN